MNKTSDSSEILRLRKELIHQRNVAADLQEELEEKTNLYIKAIADRDQYKEKLNNAKESVSRVEQIVQSKLNLLMEKERKELERLRSENQLLLQRIEIFDQEKLANQQREKTQQDKIMALTSDLQFYARNVDMRECMAKIDILRAEKNAKDKEIVGYLQEINKKSNELENALAENRTLRKMANVPENYGINAEQIKFLDREKIDDYKKLIRVLQEDNYRLEEERAKLKHMLKQQSMLYRTDQPNLRYKNLTQEQLFKVDQYVLKLLAGDTEEPADYYKLKKENQILKAQLDILNTKGFDFAKAQIEAFLKELGLGDSGKFLEKLLSGNEDIMKMLRELLTKGLSVSGGQTGTVTQQPVNPYGDFGRFRPPIPTVGADGDISSGYSYKFQTHLDVMDKDGRAGLADQTKYDVAFLQLQLSEFIELLKRKDEELSAKNNEIDHLYKKVRDYLLVQDQLYKDFVKQEKDYNERHTKQESELRSARDNLYQEQHKVKALENLVQTLQKGDKQTIENRLIELTKQNSILDVNLLKLARKYQILEEQEEILRREYHNKEADMAEKDRHVQQRINLLKEWKVRAIQQLKFLFNKLRLAVPLTEYQSIQSDNEILKLKNADYIDRNAKLELKVSKLQTQVREQMEAEEKLKTLQEIKEDLENDYEIVRKRLEQADPAFKWENAVFNKIVATLKRYRVSPQQAFEEFDVNKDGKLTRDEFLRGLDMLKVTDLSQQELDVLIGSIDTDSDGFIKYKEFVRKLSRHGVKSRTSEEQIIYLIVESLRRTGIRSLSKAFELFDKERRGSLSREDFKDVFKNMKLRIDDNDIEKFIDHFWKDKKAGIDYYEFLRIFSRYQVKLDEDGNQRKTGYDRIPDEVFRLKKRIYQEMDSAFKKSGKNLKNLFDKIDIDNSNKIEFEEFKNMFKQMELPLTEKDIRDIFNSIDFDWSGHISYPEFIADYEKTLRSNITDLIQEEKDRVEAERQGLTTAAYQANKSMGNTQGSNTSAYNSTIAGGMGRQAQDVQLQTKIDILEARLKQMGRKLETSMRVLNHAQQSQLETQQQYDQLEKKWNDLTEQFLIDKQTIRMQEEELKLSIRKDEAMKLKQLTESLQTECVETKAAMTTYKNMTEVIADQVRGLKLAMERRKDENENLVNAVREISANSEDQKRLGKLYYLIMLSRWQEAAVNKKYDMILTENRDLRRDLMNAEQNYQNKEYEHHEAENVIQDRQLQIEKLKKQIADSKNIFLTLEKAEELNNIIKEIADEKSDLEEQYFTIRTKYRTNQLLMDEAVVKAEHAQELLEFIQKSKQSEMSDRMIELSQKLQNIRLNEMRANRESNEQKEKNTYLSRLLRTQNDQLRKLEEKAAEYESKMHKREEEFRKADNERMRRFFGARFDDIPGALQGSEFEGGMSRRGGGGFRDNDAFTNFKSPQSAASGRQGVRGSGPNNKAFTEHEMYQEPEYIRRQSSIQNSQNDPRIIEGKLKRLEQEYQVALEQIRAKDIVISRFKDWQISDKYLAEDEVLRDAIEKQRGKANQVHEQEAKEMADAAAQMVKTMQEMLDQKNEQLRSKEEMIEKLRKQMMDQREQDGLEIGRLQNQLSLAAGTTLNKLQKIVIQSEHQPNGYQRHGSRYDELTREELSKALDEKDEVIKRLQSQLQGTEKSVKFLQDRNQQLLDQVGDLEHELKQEKEHLELKGKIKELERIRKELKEKDIINNRFKNTIDELNERMQNYEIKNSNVTEDQKMLKIQDGLKSKEHQGEIKKLKDKLAMVESSRNQRAEELKQANVKIQELQGNFSKVVLEKDEAQKALRQTRDRLDQEIRQREKLQIELNNIKGRIQIGGGLGSTNGPTFEQLQARNKELENDIIILQCQQKTVVVYNKETGTFEYIGEPIYLNHERELADIEEFLASMRAWLARNERLTIKSIFESMDKENFGELSEQKFEQALLRIGVKLRLQEKRMIKDVLDPRGIGFIRYRPLVKELQGIPQLDFIVKEIIKLAKLAEARDLNETQFKMLIDPTHEESMNLTQLQDSFVNVCNDQFQISKEEVEFLFKNVTKSVRTIGVVISIDRLTDKVFTALDALLIEKTKDAISKQQRSFLDLFQRHDANKDNFLEYTELERLLLECQQAFNPNCLERLYRLLDPGHRLSKISFNTFRFYISGEVSSHAVSQHQSQIVQRSYDYEPSLDRAVLSEETSQEEVTICRAGARKILAYYQNGNQQKSLVELLNQRDKLNEGLIGRDEVFSIIQESRVSELTAAELNILMKYVDKNNKGYIAINNFMEKLYELATESKQETQLRNFAMNVKRQGINLKQDLFKYDTARNGRLDKKTFAKAMNQLPISLTDEGVDMLFQAGESLDFRGALDIKYFIDKVALALKQKPLPNFQPQQTKPLAQSKIASSKQPAQGGGAFETWELEKKYKTKLSALQQQIEESKKETQAVEKQAKHWQEMANRLEKEKNGLQARLVDLNAKPPKAAREESQTQAQIETMQQLKDQVYYLQEENNKLEKNIQVELKAEIGRLNRENEKLSEKVRHFQEESKKNEYQINRLIGKPLDNIERREESELWRERKIQDLEKDLEDAQKHEHDLHEQLFKCEEKILDLKFQKETFDLQYARLQKRITDLEQYKLASSKYSAVLKHKEDEESKNIEENSNTLSNLTGLQGPGASKKAQDTVKLRSKSSKSMADLEMLVESLKRVIEKQKSEVESLKKQLDQAEKHQDKLKSEKQLRQKIEALSQEVHSYEMKDINMSEKDRTVKKLIEANRLLTQDLAKEVERYKLLENKHKEILVKYNVLAKENARNAEMLFNMNTGGNIHNYDRFLGRDDDQKKSQARDGSQGAMKSGSYQPFDRNFEDVF